MQIIIIVILCSQNVNINNISIVWLSYMYLVCISVTCRLLVTTGEFPVVTDDCHMELSGLQSAIKMISLIIPAAVRKGY